MKKMPCHAAVMTASFCAFLGLFALASVFMPDQVFSETENRYLAKFPALTWESVKTGAFGSGYETYLSDQFPFRNSWIGFKVTAERLQNKKEINGVFLGEEDYLIEALYPEDLDPELSGNNLRVLADFVLRQAKLLGEDRVRILLAPSSSEILTEKLPAHAVPFAQSLVDGALSEKGLEALLVPVRTALLEEKENAPQNPLYYRTDHHWTSYGAFTAYRAWAGTLDFSPLPLSDFTVETVSRDFSGTILSRLNIPAETDSIELFKPSAEPDWSVFYDGNPDPVHSLYSMDALETRDQYRVFLDGNHGLTRIVNPQVLGERKLLIIKDSYAHSFVPFAALHFPETLMLDLRYYNGKTVELIQNEEITDLLILYQIPGFLKDRNVRKLGWE